MSNSSMMNIRFIRSLKDRTEDDLIEICPNPFNEYRVEFTIANNFVTTTSCFKHNTTMSFADLKSYLRSLFHLLLIDQDPFEAYQFDLPLMPSVLVKHERLHELEEMVLTILEDYDSNLTWPQRSLALTKPIKAHSPLPQQHHRHLFFDEEDGRVINAHN